VDGTLIEAWASLKSFRPKDAPPPEGGGGRNPGGVFHGVQRLRKRVEEIFGWMKTVGNLRKTRHRGEDRVGWMFTLTAAAYNLVRIRNLTAAISA